MGFFDRQQIVANPGYNRWLFPPAALAVHLSIGQVYAFSVFKLPLTKIIGVTKSAPDDWSQPSLAWIFSLAIFFLGLAERNQSTDNGLKLFIYWLVVGIPLAWGIWNTLLKLPALFK
jgi:hypothetical protein